MSHQIYFPPQSFQSHHPAGLLERSGRESWAGSRSKMEELPVVSQRSECETARAGGRWLLEPLQSLHWQRYCRHRWLSHHRTHTHTRRNTRTQTHKHTHVCKSPWHMNTLTCKQQRTSTVHISVKPMKDVNEHTDARTHTHTHTHTHTDSPHQIGHEIKCHIQST